MNDLQIQQINDLRQNGQGYRTIAAKLDLPINSVKSWCRRHPLEADTADSCLYCGAKITSIPHKRQRKFCSDKCRFAYIGDTDPSSARGIRRIMRRLSMWASAYNCAIVLVGHLNGKSLAISPCREQNPLSFAVPQGFQTKDKVQLRIHSKQFVEGILLSAGLNKDKTYRVKGSYSPERNIVTFQFSDFQGLAKDRIFVLCSGE